MTESATEQQLTITKRFNVAAAPPLSSEKIGIARNVRDGIWPINGLRHPPAADTSGWYIWAGEELSDDPDFFVPLHVTHLGEWSPIAVPYLALPPGWRFLLAPGFEDVWYDQNLLTPRPVNGPDQVDREEYYIRQGGGPTNLDNPNAGLANLRHQMNDLRYQNAGGDYP